MRIFKLVISQITKIDIRNLILDIIFLWLIILIFTAIGCHKPISITNDIVAPNWINGEYLHYGIFRNDSIIGEIKTRLNFDMEEDIPVYILTILTDTELDNDNVWDSSVVCFRRDNFVPLWSWRKLETDFGFYITDTRYEDSDVDIRMETIDGKQSANLNLSPPYFDNEMVLTLLRAVQFRHARKYSFNVAVPILLLGMNNTIRYGGKTTLTTPTGTFKCDKIYLVSPQNKIITYYEQNNPRRLICYQREKSKTSVILLTSN